MGVHVHPSPMPREACRDGGSLRSRPQAPDRYRRSDDHGANARWTARYGRYGVQIGMAFSCTCTPMSDVHAWIGTASAPNAPLPIGSRPDSVRSKTGVGRPATLRHEPRRDYELHLGRRGPDPRHLQARRISGRDLSAHGAAPTRLGAGSHEAEDVGCPREVPAQDRGPPGAPASERSLSRWRSARRPRMVGDKAQS